MPEWWNKPTAPAQQPGLKSRLLSRPIGRFGLILLSLLAWAHPAPAEPTALEIMTRVNDRETGYSETATLDMVLEDSRGHQRRRSLKSFSRDVEGSSQNIIFFLAPANLKDTAFLTYDYDDPNHDDDQWLYLPALRRTKRIAGGDRSDSFMGSDFSYADMTTRPLNRYAYSLMKETDVNGIPAWQIEAIPNEEETKETGYTRSILFVRQDNYVPIRGVNWVKKGKRLKYFDVERLEQIDGIWVATQISMTTKKGKKTLHRTRIRRENVTFNQPLDARLFTARSLERGI
ncbi:MAG: hypothetical protein CBC48_11000 [bacterium TMED88]|nr:outer membrane lipoprotein-sorting protein [Deltaproteobacteria bacterium]OUV30058.1 MAG: hypothetical protein CBC48_11000 [bacterium TMED88]